MKKLMIAGLLATALAGLAPAFAQDYPNKPITLIIPIPPGGATDILARVVGEKMGKILGQPVVTENHGGASGQIGLGMLARAAPDGYTIGSTGTSYTVITKAVGIQTNYDPIDGFEMIGQMATSGSVIGVNPSVPVNNIAELVEYAKANPDSLSYATPGNGSTLHLLGELFNQTAGTQILHVPFSGGGPSLAGVIGDSGVLMGMFTIPSALSAIQSGQLKALAVLDDKRYPGLPDVPALTETFPDVKIPSSFYLLAAPAGTPEDILAKLNAAMTEALADPEVTARLGELAFTAVPAGPDEADQIIASDLAIWQAVVDTAGIKVE